MGGQEGARGYFYQAFASSLQALNNSNWDKKKSLPVPGIKNLTYNDTEQMRVAYLLDPRT